MGCYCIYKVLTESLPATQNWDLLIRVTLIKASSQRAPVDNRLSFKHIISRITFTGFNWTAHKIKRVFKCLSGSEPKSLRGAQARSSGTF